MSRHDPASPADLRATASTTTASPEPSPAESASADAAPPESREAESSDEGRRVGGLARRIAALDPEQRAVFLRRLAARRGSGENGDTAGADAPGTSSGRSIPRLDDDGEPVPLSFAQARFWFAEELARGLPVANEGAVHAVDGPLDPALLGRALVVLTRRHGSLRTVVGADGRGEPWQRLADPGELPLPFARVDLSALPAGRRDAEGEALAAAEVGRPFDLDRPPLHRLTVFDLGHRAEDRNENEAENEDAQATGARRHLVALVLHHLISDGSSFAILLGELWSVYRALAEGREPELPDLPVRAIDFAAWQRRRIEEGRLDGQLEHWRKRLSPPPPTLPLPADRPGDGAGTGPADLEVIRLEPDATTALSDLCRDEDTTLYTLLVTAFAALLQRLTGEDDVAVGSTVADRSHPACGRLVGCLINLLVFRVDAAGDPGVRELLGRVRSTILEAFENRDIPFDRVVEELAPRRDPGVNPFFQVALNQRDDPMAQVEVPGLAFHNRPRAHRGATGLDWVLEMGREEDGRQTLFLSWNAERFDRSTMERIRGHLVTLLTGLAADPDRPLGRLPLLRPAERQQLLHDWARGEAPTPLPGHDRVPTLPERILAVAARRPAAPVALGPGDAELSWGELVRRARRLAAALERRLADAAPQAPVALRLDRRPELLVAILGTWLAGRPYLPLDPELPPARSRFLVEDAEVPLIVTAPAGAPEAAGGSSAEPGPPGVACVDLEQLLDAGRAPDDGADGGSRSRGARAAFEPERLAYVIYTSGSTGRPKGVALTHRGLANLTAAQHRRFGAGPESRMLQFASSSFDASVMEMSIALGAGAALVYGRRDELLPGPALVELLERHRVTHAMLPPAAAEILDPELIPELDPDGLDHLEFLMVGGAACPASVVERWAPGRRLFNAYGPTEVTVWATTERCRAGSGRPPAIGRPGPGMVVHLLDRRGAPVPVGVAGEVTVGGRGLARGYLGRPGTTAARFVPDPFAEAPGERLYRTGDLARRRPDGRLDFLGRIDFQVKLRGFRIELGEVEAALVTHPAVRRALAALDESGSEPALVAWVETASGEAPEDWKAHLGRRLPAPLVPGRLSAVAELPTTSSGKVDRGAIDRLPAPNAPGTDTGTAFSAPSGERERELAALWRDLLGVERIGSDDNFFDLGGHSLLLMKLLAALRSRGFEDLAITELFQHPTVGSLARHLERRGDADPETRSRRRRDQASRRADRSRAALGRLAGRRNRSVREERP